MKKERATFFDRRNGFPINRPDREKSRKITFPPIFDITDKYATPLEITNKHFFAHQGLHLGWFSPQNHVAEQKKVIGKEMESYTSMSYCLYIFIEKRHLHKALISAILKPERFPMAHFKALRILLKKGGTTFFDRRNGFPINRPDREKS